MDDNDRPVPEDALDDIHGVTISSMDILQQKFAVRFRGYDVRDVESFLEVVAREMERLNSDNVRMHRELAELKEALGVYRSKEDSINAALVTVQKMADEIKNRALSEAEKTVAEGKRLSEQLLAEAQQTRAALEAENAELHRKADEELGRLAEDARAAAARMKEDLRHEQLLLEEEIARLKQQRMQFRVSLKTLIETHLQMMEHDREA